ncbi:MAG: hypothetical protein AAB495_04145 [Patescibacteria group bacterium]
MNNQKLLGWVLRIAVAGEFLGHGMFALQGKKDWIAWVVKIAGTSDIFAAKFIFAVGILDILVALLVLVVRPIPAVLLWAAFWGFWTALVRPLVGQPIWDFVERWANWGAPLALLLLSGWPTSLREWFRPKPASM